MPFKEKYTVCFVTSIKIKKYIDIVLRDKFVNLLRFFQLYTTLEVNFQIELKGVGDNIWFWWYKNRTLTIKIHFEQNLKIRLYII